MLLNQTYTLTPKIQAILNTLEGQKTACVLIPIQPDFVIHLRRNSLLNSALYSARIEGITGSSDLDKLAVQNLERTYTWLYHQPLDLKLDIDLLKTVHGKSLHNLRSDAGHFRTEQSAIFNSAGVAVYLTPPPQDIHALLTTWQDQVMRSSHHPLIQALIAHYQFEKIHPFLDGNGRVGRLILTQQLRHTGYDFHGLLILEQGINNTRDDYYYHLQGDNKDLTNFIEYFLTLISNSASAVLAKITQSPQITSSFNLLPRRQELLNIIKDHRVVSFDFLHRRFAGTPSSTLRYDLLQLKKGGHIQKLGNTRGALYSVSPTE